MGISSLEFFILGVERNADVAFLDRLDHRNLFLNPVNKSDVPDYFDIVKVPMDWATMSDKLEWHEYHSAKDFKVCLLCRSCDSA